MENTVFNDTATKDHEDWKKKKGYGPIIVAVSLALLFSLSAGGYLGSGTNLPPSLHRDEKEMTNAVASSSSTSLVGAGTAQGGSSAYCKKNTGYNCGAVFPPGGNTCGQKGCCCNQEYGEGFKLNSCDSAKGYAYRGCNSCWGGDACFKTNNVNIGDTSCHGTNSCFKVSDSTIGNDSCQDNYSCEHTSNINVGTSSCHGISSCRFVSDSTIDNDSCHGRVSCYFLSDSNGDSTIGKQCCLGEVACYYLQSSTIHDGSCQGDHTCDSVKNSIIGKGSCSSTDGYSCYYSENVKIGNNSCNGGGVCKQCKHDVPDNACNQGVTDDMDINGFCNYCM